MATAFQRRQAGMDSRGDKAEMEQHARQWISDTLEQAGDAAAAMVAGAMAVTGMADGGTRVWSPDNYSTK